MTHREKCVNVKGIIRRCLIYQLPRTIHWLTAIKQVKLLYVTFSENKKKPPYSFSCGGDAEQTCFPGISVYSNTWKFMVYCHNRHPSSTCAFIIAHKSLM